MVLEIMISDETIKQHEKKTHYYVSNTAFTRGRFSLPVPFEKFQRTERTCTYVKVYVTSPYVGKTRSRRQINHTKVRKTKAVMTVTTASERLFYILRTNFLRTYLYLMYI